jgi:hypothetical protein
VLVGLLVKILGSIGFFGAVFSGRFPLAMGWTIITSDRIWWKFFGLILRARSGAISHTLNCHSSTSNCTMCDNNTSGE